MSWDAWSWITVAGGREDLTLKARSLGRHGGARPNRVASWCFAHDPDAPTTTLSERAGLRSTDACDKLRWVLRQLRQAGIDAVAALDLTLEQMLPAHAVRVIIPDLESNHEFRTAQRARMAMLEDLLPRWYP